MCQCHIRATGTGIRSGMIHVRTFRRVVQDSHVRCKYTAIVTRFLKI
jgi:hypothetical protein